MVVLKRRRSRPRRGKSVSVRSVPWPAKRDSAKAVSAVVASEIREM